MIHKQKAKSRKLKVISTGIATILTLAFSLSTISAQESVNATGGNASGSGGQASYSVGQVVYTTNTGTSGSVVEGVQQPYEISVITAIVESEGISLSVKAYPNPSTDYLILSIDESDISDLSYLLYDMNGRLLQNKKITVNQTSIVMRNLVSGTYFVKVILKTQGIVSQQEIKTFKIIKN